MSGDKEPASGRRYRPLLQLIAARLREFWREPAAIFWVYVFPLLMIAALGVAFRNRPPEQLTALVQQGGRAAVVRDALNADERFDVAIADAQHCQQQLRTGKVDLVIVAGETADQPIQYRYDPTRPGSHLARSAADDVLQRAAGRTDPVTTRDVEVVEPGGRYIDFLIPGMLGLGIMGGGMWGVGFAVVDMRIRKLLKRLVATPMKRTHFLLALMVSRLLFTIPEIIVLLIFARVAFGVVIQGSYLAVAVLILLGTFEFTGIGLLAACRAKTLESISGLMNLVMLPMWMASGIFFSYERFPDAVQPAIRLLPLTPLIDALRSVMLEGTTLWSLGNELAVIVGWAIVTFLLALLWFRWN